MIQDILAWATVLSLAAIVAAMVVTVLTHVWWRLPFIPTPTATVRTMVTLAKIRPKERVYDLGAGDGRLLFHARRVCPSCKAQGFEVALLVWLLAQLNIFFKDRKVSVKLQNFFSHDLRDADVIFLYLIPHLMPKLQKKLEKELRPGTRIVSHAFSFPNRKPDSTHEVDATGWGKTKVHVYTW